MQGLRDFISGILLPKGSARRGEIYLRGAVFCVFLPGAAQYVCASCLRCLCVARAHNGDSASSHGLLNSPGNLEMYLPVCARVPRVCVCIRMRTTRPQARRDNVGELSPNPTLPPLFLSSAYFSYSPRLPIPWTINRPFQFRRRHPPYGEHKYRDPSGSAIRSHLISAGSILRA